MYPWLLMGPCGGLTVVTIFIDGIALIGTKSLYIFFFRGPFPGLIFLHI